MSSLGIRWRKLGHVYAPDGKQAWNATHAAAPFAEPLEGDVFQIYFTTRDAQNRSYICRGRFDLRARKMIDVEDEPIIAPGQLGLFDDSGAVMGYLLNFKGAQFLYYLGWNLRVTVPWLNTIGLAIYNPKTKRFEKYGRVPVMDRSDIDPFSISYPSILEENGCLKMWYGSNLSWGVTQDEMQHVFKTAYSHDAIHWERTGRIAVDLIHPNEYALSKPFVLKSKESYEMWYSYRANRDILTYRIGYATSANGDDWIRDDEHAGIDVSDEGWDSEMICYPFVFDHKGARYMLYNGNAYGKTGFGLAVVD